MFVDTARIFVKSGKGGDGRAHLRQEKSRPKGGPDGGDGGRGGDVVLFADAHLDSLVEFAYKAHWFAQEGEGGLKKSCAGKDGEHCVVSLPLGSQVFDEATGDLVADMLTAGQRVVIAPGGAGGFGNERFKSATHQTPLESTPGGEAVERTLRIELKLIADVGFVGLPNAGKSTLLKACTRTNPRIASFPFTTLNPQLGIAELSGERRLILADLPGLIEGAAEGAGLGHEFLRHIERTRVLLHIVDAAPIDGSDPLANYATIRRELAAFSDELARREELVVLNKIDLIPAELREEFVKDLVKQFKKKRAKSVLAMSGATGEGVRATMEACWLKVAPARAVGS
ncbi:MAG: GTPase ObgE [Phycisphaerales bacterium]|nr:GTPase ObgE [Phycisphaerales bacterium]